MKYVIGLIAVLVLIGCDQRPQVVSNSGQGYRVECIDGIEYWFREQSKRAYMAVRVDPNTLSFVRCDRI